MPIAAIAFAIIFFLLPLKRVTGSYVAKLKQVDWLGSALTLAWVMLALIALSWAGSQYRWDSAAVLAPLLFGVALLGAFVYTEAKVRLPLIPLYIFRDSTVSAAMATTFFSGIAYYGVMYHLPQYFQQVHGASAIRSGLLVLPLSLCQTAFVFGAGFLTSKTGDFWWSMVAGFAIWTVGLGLMSTIGTNSTDAQLIGYQVIIALGAGLTFQTSLVAIQAAVSRKDMATATGTRNFMRMVGGTIGLAACGTIVNNLTARELARMGYTQVEAIIANPDSQAHEEDLRAAYGRSSSCAADLQRKAYKGSFTCSHPALASASSSRSCLSKRSRLSAQTTRSVNCRGSLGSRRGKRKRLRGVETAGRRHRHL